MSPVIRNVFFFLSPSLKRARSNQVIVVDVDGVLFYSPVIDLVRALIVTVPGTLLHAALKLYRCKHVRWTVQRFLRLNPRAVAYVRLRAKQGYIIAYCTGRTPDSVPELIEVLTKHGLPVHILASRAGAVSNLMLKLYIVALLKRKGYTVSEVNDDAGIVIRALSDTARVYLWRRGKPSAF